MSDTQKMLRAIINGQSSLKQEILQEIKKTNQRIDKLEKKVDTGFSEVHKRIDNIGKQLAYLEDDTPTHKEFEKLEKRVSKLEVAAV